MHNMNTLFNPLSHKDLQELFVANKTFDKTMHVAFLHVVFSNFISIIMWFKNAYWQMVRLHTATYTLQLKLYSKSENL